MRENVLTLCIAMVMLLAAGCSSSGGGNSKFLETYDSNSDGTVSRQEYMNYFDMMDSNDDDVIDSGEAGSVFNDR
jgi:hypothetical protein